MTPAHHRLGEPAFEFGRYGLLAFMLTAGPLAWMMSLLLKFVLASHACLGARDLDARFSQYSAYAVIDILAIAVIGVAASFAYREARDTAAQSLDKFHDVSHVGEAREHFLALWSLLISALFIVAIVFGLVADVTVSPCTL